MIVQWCLKGMWLEDDEAARQIIDSREGIISNWWRRKGLISNSEKREKLTSENLDLHVNHFSHKDANSGFRVSEDTPFISLSCGTVERDVLARTNIARSALGTALWFGTDFNRRDTAYIYTCWVILGPRPAPDIEGVAEEVRDLNSYRRFSDYQPEGEVAAKISVPENHVQRCDKWIREAVSGTFRLVWTHSNPTFTHPETLSNVRELI